MSVADKRGASGVYAVALIEVILLSITYSILFIAKSGGKPMTEKEIKVDRAAESNEGMQRVIVEMVAAHGETAQAFTMAGGLD